VPPHTRRRARCRSCVVCARGPHIGPGRSSSSSRAGWGKQCSRFDSAPTAAAAGVLQRRCRLTAAAAATAAATQMLALPLLRLLRAQRRAPAAAQQRRRRQQPRQPPRREQSCGTAQRCGGTSHYFRASCTRRTGRSGQQGSLIGTCRCVTASACVAVCDSGGHCVRGCGFVGWWLVCIAWRGVGAPLPQPARVHTSRRSNTGQTSVKHRSTSSC
jgi:hypothetical protein